MGNDGVTKILLAFCFIGVESFPLRYGTIFSIPNFSFVSSVLAVGSAPAIFSTSALTDSPAVIFNGSRVLLVSTAGAGTKIFGLGVIVVGIGAGAFAAT